MPRLGILLCSAVLLAGANSVANAQPSAESIPVGPFRTVHLMIVPKGQETALMAAISDYNREFQAQGCTACGYHLFKLGDAQKSKYNYSMMADWPGRDGYIKLHTTAGFKKIGQKNPIFDKLDKTQLYGRYVAVK